MNKHETILFESHPQPLWIYDVDSLDLLDVNEKALTKFGYSREEFLSLRLKDLHPQSEIQNIEYNLISNVLGYNDAALRVHIKKNGSIFYSRIIAQTIEYKKKRAKLVLSQDISDGNNRNDLLETSYDQLKYHVTNGPMAIIEWDKDLKIKTWTNKALKIFGYPESNIQGKDSFTLTEQYVIWDERNAVKERIKELVAGNVTNNHFEITINDYSGNKKYTRWYNSVLKNEIGEPVSIFSLIEDITSQRLAEDELHKSQQLYKSLFDNSLDAIILIDDDMRIIDANNASCRLLGYSFEELYMKSVDYITPVPFIDEERNSWNDFILKGKKEGEYNLKNKAGEVITIEFRAVSNIMPGVHLSVLRDITKRKKAEEKIKNALLEKEALLTEMHHRVKNNLAVISGLLDLQKEVTEDSIARNALRDSQMRVHSIAMIHEKLYHNDNLSQIRFDDYIKNLTQLIRNSHKFKEKNINVIFDTEEVSICVNQAIPCGLIVNEIVNNAFEHAFKDRDSGTVLISFKKVNDEYKMNISDNGLGLPEDISIISQSLGLTLIRTLARQLKANVKLKNENGVHYSLSFKG